MSMARPHILVLAFDLFRNKAPHSHKTMILTRDVQFYVRENLD